MRFSATWWRTIIPFTLHTARRIYTFSRSLEFNDATDFWGETRLPTWRRNVLFIINDDWYPIGWTKIHLRHGSGSSIIYGILRLSCFRAHSVECWCAMARQSPVRFVFPSWHRMRTAVSEYCGPETVIFLHFIRRLWVTLNWLRENCKTLLSLWWSMS